MYVLPQSEAANLIIPRLWIGSAGASKDTNFLKTNGITVVFNCTKDLPFDSSIRRCYRVPIDDNLQRSELRNLELWSFEIVAKLSVEYKAGNAILVHCHAGMQRSCAVVAMYLIATHKMSSDDAIAYIRNRRPVAFMPSANFEPSIKGFERSLQNALEDQHE